MSYFDFNCHYSNYLFGPMFDWNRKYSVEQCGNGNYLEILTMAYTYSNTFWRTFKVLSYVNYHNVRMPQCASRVCKTCTSDKLRAKMKQTKTTLFFWLYGGKKWKLMRNFRYQFREKVAINKVISNARLCVQKLRQCCWSVRKMILDKYCFAISATVFCAQLTVEYHAISHWAHRFCRCYCCCCLHHRTRCMLFHFRS